jgi:uncharacterized membrane protein YbhN (UPF0104 family)
MPSRQRLFFAIRIAAWLAVGACVIVFARKLDWDQVFGAFAGVDLRLAILATVVGLPCTALQGLRWAALVKPVASVPRMTMIAALYVGQAASALLPMRAGEAVRTELLSRASGMGRARALGTVALDHAINGLVMFALAATLPLLLPVPRWLAIALWGGMLLAVSAGLLLLRLARHPGTEGDGRIGRLVVRLRTGLAAARDPRAVAEAALFAALAWAVEIAVAMIALDAFHLPHDLAHAMAVLFGVNVALAIPSPPAALGSFELGAGTALVAFGGPTERAAAFALGYHAMQLLPTLVMGGLMLAVFRKRAPIQRIPLAEA